MAANKDMMDRIQKTPSKSASSSENVQSQSAQRTAALKNALRSEDTSAPVTKKTQGPSTTSTESPLPQGIPLDQKKRAASKASQSAQRRPAYEAGTSAKADQSAAQSGKKPASSTKSAAAAPVPATEKTTRRSKASNTRRKGRTASASNKKAASKSGSKAGSFAAGVSNILDREVKPQKTQKTAGRVTGRDSRNSVRGGHAVRSTNRARTTSTAARRGQSSQPVFKKARRNTKNMSFGEKVQYYISQIGPTLQAIKADPAQSEVLYRVIVFVVALLLAIYMTSCANDIMGFNRSDNEITVNVSAGVSTDDLIKQFRKAGLIKHTVVSRTFVKMTSGIRGDSEAKYLKGEYFLSPSMGVEKMLMTCQAVQKKETVEVTFPEGYTVEQMAEKMEDAKVCTKEDFLEACNKVSYDYDFLEDVTNVKQRYIALEGYLYPDTYEFYVGEDAESCVSKILNNFSTNWTDEYAERAEELNMSVDDVITLASIIQKEDSNPDNMAIIASVFYNRLNSTSFPSLQSDATNNYVNKYIKPNVSANEYKLYRSRYSTYVCVGLPVGPICSPGDDAIHAVLWPETTNYYYFAHDSDGTLHAASSEVEQNVNVYNDLADDD